MAWALPTRQAPFCRSAHFDEEYTGNGLMYLVEKKIFWPFDMYIINYIKQYIDLLALLGWNKFPEHTLTFRTRYSSKSSPFSDACSEIINEYRDSFLFQFLIVISSTLMHKKKILNIFTGIKVIHINVKA